MSITLIYVTAPSREEALRIGRAVVEERLAACANVVGGVTSLYWWSGAVQEDAEAILVLKTQASLVDALTGRIGELHSYQCPCVVALPIGGGNPDFLAWVEAETGLPPTV
jgi:periplasmic divalent cation tolerance protein